MKEESQEKKTMAKGKKISKKRILKAIKDSAGVKSEICRRIGCARITFYSYLDKDPDIKAAYDEECENILDLGEARLFESVNAAQPWAVMFLLSRRGKTRGYTETQEINASVNNTGGVLIVPGAATDPDAWSRAVQDQQAAVPGKVDG